MADIENGKSTSEYSKEEQIKRIYHRLVKNIHPDIRQEVTKSQELMDLWHRVSECYKNNDLEGLQELEEIVNDTLKLDITYIDEEADSMLYPEELSLFLDEYPDVVKPLIQKAKDGLSKIEKALYTAPALINAVKAAIPDMTLQAVLTDDQKQKIAKGVLKLMTKRNGELMANLIDPKTKKIVATIPLKSVNMAPELTQAMTSFSYQMQMAQIAEQIQAVQIAVEEVRMGQEYDRLATAYSCKQKFLQTMEIKNPKLKEMALLQLALSAEESRNLLMLSQKSNVEFIKEQPESFFKKVLTGATTDKINSRMSEIRESLCAVNMVSFVETMAYQELGEPLAARKSLEYYASFIEDTYMSVQGLLERLDMIDPSPENYWTKALPDIDRKIKELPSITDNNKKATKSIGRKQK